MAITGSDFPEHVTEPNRCAECGSTNIDEKHCYDCGTDIK